MELDWFSKRAELHPDKPAVADTGLGREWTYGEMEERIKACVRRLYSLGVRKGDRVAVLAPNHVSYFDLLFACGRLGAIFVPLNWKLSGEEINYILGDCRPEVIAFHPEVNSLLAELQLNGARLLNVSEDGHLSLRDGTGVFQEARREEEPLTIFYTGGTTGRPKGVVLSHRSVFWNALNTVLSWNLTDEDITLTCLPLYHTGGMNALSVPVLMAGGKVVLCREFDPRKTVELIHQFRCTNILLVPTMYRRLIDTEEFKQSAFPSMKVFLSGGAPCPPDIYEAFHKKGLSFKEGYGLTEAGPNNFYIDPAETKTKKGSVGKPMLFNEVRIVRDDGSEAGSNEPGELLIRGKHMFNYYWNNERATGEVLKDGWLYTGDLAKKDEDGYYYLVGRKKEMMISGGENIFPVEIENWLITHPDVGEAAVVGIPDQHWGEKAVAFIVKKGENVREEDLISFCSRKLARFKIPKHFFFVDELPKTHVGKIDKKALQKMGIYLNKTAKQ